MLDHVWLAEAASWSGRGSRVNHRDVGKRHQKLFTSEVLVHFMHCLKLVMQKHSNSAVQFVLKL